MVKSLLGLTVLATVMASTAYAQAPAPVPAPAPAGQTQAPATTPAPGGRGNQGNQGVGSQGDPDPGVHYVVIVDNPQVRVLQVTLQPGAVRKPHVHNDVTFHMMVPVTGSLELTVENQISTAVPGQAYYMVKGQVHGFTNKTAAPVQVIELFIKPPAAPAAATQ